MSCTRTTRRAYTSYECNANTSRARRHQERRGTGPHHTMIEAHTACLPQLRRGGTLRKQQRWFEQAARSSFEFFFLKRQRGANLHNLWQESAATHGSPGTDLKRPPASTSTSGRSSLACMLGTQHDDGPTDTRVRTTRALWFWWSGIGTQPFHELAHTHTTLHHHLATRRTHAHAQHKILATHGCEGLTLHT